MIRTAILAALALVCAALPAEARHRHAATACVETGSVMHPVCGMGELAAPSSNFLQGVRSISVTMHRVKRHARRAYQVPSIIDPPVTQSAEAIVPHPAGCPRSAFCGCGAAVRIFGSPVRSLWLAANWFRFPRAAPAPGMAAVRRHHVMVLEADLGGGVWRVYDANSGHHLTRIHARSIAGYAIVDPRAG